MFSIIPLKHRHHFSTFIMLYACIPAVYKNHGCDGLRELHIMNEHPEEMEISEYAFEYLKNCTLYVPAGTEDAYRRHPVVSWRNFKEIVIEK